MLRNRRLLAAWIACFAVLTAALAPTISHFLAFDDPWSAHGSGAIAHLAFASAAEDAVCHTPTEADDVRLTGFQLPAEPAVPHQPTQHLEHCPFCIQHTVALALEPHTYSLFAVHDRRAERPALFYQSTRPLAIWASAQPRGPPASA